ncbi:MAG TPA: Do family serine endopeptidase [Gemmatimonadales bacterium]|nr:Do family serine endopeptidase [Gemmatimonadales bacterium]
MSGRTRDWLKLGSLVGIAFVFGLILTSALDLPKRSGAAETALAQAPAVRPQIPAAKPAADLGEAFAAVAEHVKPAVVFIRAERREPAANLRLPPGFEDFFRVPRRPQIQEGNGSGFIVSADGYILTNNHVVQGADRVTVRLYDKREFEAKVVGTDANTDVAVIKIDARNLPTATLGNSDSTRIGEWVLAIGNPLGEAFAFTVTAGIVSAKGRGLAGLRGDNTYSIQDFIQTDAAINPGNSGGPLVNVRGEVIGINSAIASETGYYAGYGFAIPINLAREVMRQLIESGRVERAIMGVAIREITPLDAEAVGLKEIKGVVVNDYSSDDSPARRAGIRPGDVIVALDGEPIEYVAQLQQKVGFKKPGETVQVTVLREGGERRTLTVRLAPAPAEGESRVASGDGGRRRGSGEAAPMEEALGISVEPLSAQEARDERLREVVEAGGGMLVTDVSPDGPAYQRLLPPDQGGPDVILRINGQPVRTRAEFRKALEGVKAGDIVTLQVYNPRFGAQRVVRLRAR